jgi:hypothetical protein
MSNFSYLINLDVYEIFVWLLYVLIGLGFIYVYKAFNTNKYTKFLIPGYLFKVIGALTFTLVYIYYYKQGDCNTYYFGTSQLVDIFYQKPSVYFNLIFMDNLEAREYIVKQNFWVFTLNNAEAWFLTKFLSPLNILSFNSYLGLTFFTSLISFNATYKLYVTFDVFLPNQERRLFFIIFAFPSVLFWGGGVMKDTVTLASFYYIIVFFYKAIYERKYHYFVYMIIPAYLLLNLKAYILISFIPWLMISLFYYFINLSKNPVLKFIVVPYLILILVGSMSILTATIMSSTAKYQSEQIENRVKGFQTYHTQLGGSSYNLGEVDFSTMGIISKIPLALNATFFRPYPWEARNFMSFLNSLESFFVMCFTVFVIIKTGFFNFFRILASNSYLLGGFVFVLFFGFVVGFTSFNFGALSRFKIPIVSIYVYLLYFIFVNRKNRNLEKI